MAKHWKKWWNGEIEQHCGKTLETSLKWKEKLIVLTMGRLSKTGGKTVKKTLGRLEWRGKWCRVKLWKSNEKKMASMWIDGKQWKNWGTMLKKWSQTMEKQWQNCGSDGTSIESTYRQKTIESASETVYTVSRLGLVCLSVLRRTYASSSRIGQNNTCFYR